MRDTIPLLDTVLFEFDGNKPAIVTLQGIKYDLNGAGDPASDIITLLTASDVGLTIPEDDIFSDKVEAFSYVTSSDWTKQVITLDEQQYSLYQNKLVFGETKVSVVLSFVVKNVTSNSMSFYEDLVGKVLVGGDIKAFAWLLAVGNTITGRRLSAVKISSKLEQINKTTIYNAALQIMTTKSNSPKYMYIMSNDMTSVIALDTIESVTIRKQENTIVIVFLTKEKLTYALELI